MGCVAIWLYLRFVILDDTERKFFILSRRMDLRISANVLARVSFRLCAVACNGFPRGLQQGRPSRCGCRQEGLVDSDHERALVTDVARQLGEESASITTASELQTVSDHGDQPSTDGTLRWSRFKRLIVRLLCYCGRSKVWDLLRQNR